MSLAILDANVLYPQTLRDVLLSIGEAKLFRPLWSDQILEEWVHHVLADRPHLSPERLARTVEYMNTYFPDARVTGFEHRIESLTLPDPDDRHVLAAAMEVHATHIVTFNLKDFPAIVLRPLDIWPVHPDTFLQSHLTNTSERVCSALREMRLRLTKPAVSKKELLDILARSGLPRFVAALTPHAHQL